MKFLNLLLLTLFAIPSFAQPDFGDPDLDDAILNSKQYKRVTDFSDRRNSGVVNGEWLKLQAWEDVKSNPIKASMTPWENHGPDTIGGRTISIDFHPTDPNTFLVGSASGGLWETNDYGATWQCLTDDYMTMGVGAVAYNPQDPNSIIIASGEGYGFGGEFTQGFGVFISYDGGDNWYNTAIAATYDQYFAGMDIVWNPVDTTIVNIASSFGCYHSTDGGINYTYTLDRLGGRMMADPQNENRLYFTARYYTSTYPGGFYISTDAGASWTLSGAGLPIPDEFGYTGMDIHPTSNNIIFLTVSQSSAVGSGPLEGLYKSTDFGATFTSIPTTQDMMCYPPPYDYICQGWYDNTILMDLTDPTILYSGGTRLWKSTDEGITWNVADLAGATYAVHPDHHQTLWHPLTGDLFDCNDGGVDYSSDGGLTWTKIGDGLITHQFYSIASSKSDPDIVIGGTQDIGNFASLDAHGGSWTNIISGDAFGCAIANTASNVWYNTNYINTRRVKSVDFGGSWFDANAGTDGSDQWRMPIVIHPENDNILLSANNNFIYKSTNGAASWTAVYAAGPIGGIEFDKQNPDLVYAHNLYSGEVYQSINGGDTWGTLGSSPGAPITDLAADPSNSGTVYATVGGYGPGAQVFVSTNAGVLWSNISNNIPEVPANTIAVSPSNDQEIYVGNEFGVWVSLDAGANWQSFNDGLPAAVVVEDLHLHAADTSVRIGTYGRGYWKTDAMAKTFAGVQKIEKENKVAIYPNPSSEMFMLSKEIGTYKVYDQQGRMILEGDSKKIDLSKYPAGIYVLRTVESIHKLIKL